MTYQDWLDWRSNPVTKAFYEASKERIEDTKDMLSTSAGIDAVQDNFYRGFIAAYREMMDFRVEE